MAKDKNNNTGENNSGDRNSGNRNSGYRNSGDGNSGNGNSGLFNTDEPKMRIFNKQSDLTYSEWLNSNLYVYFNIPLNVFIGSSEMTDEEKKENPEWKTCGGYLKTLEYKEAWAKWWEENKDEHDKVKKLPNFNAEIFKEITGIDVEVKDKEIELSNGAKISEKTIQEALKFVAEHKK